MRGLWKYVSSTWWDVGLLWLWNYGLWPHSTLHTISTMLYIENESRRYSYPCRRAPLLPALLTKNRNLGDFLTTYSSLIKNMYIFAHISVHLNLHLVFRETERTCSFGTVEHGWHDFAALCSMTRAQTCTPEYVRTCAASVFIWISFEINIRGCRPGRRGRLQRLYQGHETTEQGKSWRETETGYGQSATQVVLRATEQQKAKKNRKVPDSWNRKTPDSANPEKKELVPSPRELHRKITQEGIPMKNLYCCFEPVHQVG